MAFGIAAGAQLVGCSSGAPAAETKSVPGGNSASADGKGGSKEDSGKANGGTAQDGTATSTASASDKGAALAAEFKRPETVRGIYVTAWTAGGTKRMNNLIANTKSSVINAFVIDIRDNGEMYFKTGIPLAKSSGAETIAVVNAEKLMTRLKEGGVYPIARIACFRDAHVPKKHPGQAVQVAGGAPWKDHSGHTWLDPYDKRNWEYLFKTIDFAMDLGFPEIQLDYVRFPSEGSSKSQVFPNKKSYTDPKATPSAVITEFCNEVVKRTKARGRVCSADIFGIISSGTTDQGIGQTLEMIAQPFDLICPMVYPSHFAKGEYGIANPNASPYAIIRKSLGDYKRRVPKSHVRPWLQDFSLGVNYGAKEVQAQIKAAHELGYDEYLLWNAGNRYTWSALKKPAAQAKESSAAKPA